MGLRDLISSKKLFDRAHREKKPLDDFGEFDETILSVECARCFVFRVHDDSRRRGLSTQFETSIQSVHQQLCSQAFAPKVAAHSEATEVSCRYGRIYGDFFYRFFCHFPEINCVLGERVVARDDLSIRC